MSKLTEYIDILKENISMKEDMSEIDVIRYVYIDLGRKMDFDLNYTFGNSKLKTKIYNKVVDEEELENIIQTHTAICKSISYLLKRILKEFDVDIKVVREDNMYGGKRRKAYV